MMNVTNDLRLRRFILAGIMLAVTLGTTFNGAGSNTQPSCTTVSGTFRNNTCPAITFDSSANFAGAGTCTDHCPNVTSISATITATTGDMLIVFASSENLANAPTGNITSVTDTSTDSFTQDLKKNLGSSFCCDSEVWHTLMGAGIETVTVTWQNVFIMAFTLILVAYKNTNGIGAKASAGCTPFCSGVLNTTLIMTKTGSLVAGSETWELAENCDTTNIGIGKNQTRTGFACVRTTDTMGSDSEDNSPASYSNGFPYFYNNQNNSNIDDPMDYTLVAVELLPSGFNGPNVAIQDVDPFCPITGATCHINFVSKASGPTAANKALALGTTYCTGITSAALTTTGGSVEIWASYTGDSLNITGLKLFIQAAISTSAPSTTFGAGHCTATFTQVGRADLYFPIAGALSTTNEFSIAINGFATPAAGTWYAWLEITAQNFPLGSAGFTQVPTIGPATITMAELK